MSEIKVPNLGEGIEKVVVAYWYVNAGDHILKESEVVDVVTDKASFNISSDEPGILKQILVSAGEEARIGDAIAIIEP